MRRKNGITLIALIITVIVMIILAGVAINLTIGENGIFKKSEEGAEIYKNATNHEENSLKQTDTKMNELINQYHGGSTVTEKPGKPDEDGIYTKNSTINGERATAFNPEIPKGFKPVDIDDAIWGSEEGYKKGLVIEDKEGNQFVWVAVDGEVVKLNRYTFADDGTETAQGENAVYNYQELASSPYGNEVARDINTFKTSVIEHGGYYFARYEASKGADGKPKSKVANIWNNITQPNSAIAARNMYDTSYGVVSDLVNSYAWDTAIVFVQKYSGDTDYSIQSSLNKTLANTGVNGDEKCHINDMASNCFEWITETSYNNSNPCVCRGGNYLEGATRDRNFAKTSTIHAKIAFRTLLYL